MFGDEHKGVVMRTINTMLGLLLLTTLLDANEHPAEDLVVLDHRRWEEEMAEPEMADFELRFYEESRQKKAAAA